MNGGPNNHNAARKTPMHCMIQQFSKFLLPQMHAYTFTKKTNLSRFFTIVHKITESDDNDRRHIMTIAELRNGIAVFGRKRELLRAQSVVHKTELVGKN